MDSDTNGNKQRLPCAKYNREQDSQDPHCSDPELYCKYRTACLIHFMEKDNQRRDDGPTKIKDLNRRASCR